MNSRKFLYLTSLLLAFSLFVPGQGWTQMYPSTGTPPKPGNHGPIITHAFAVEKGYYGYIWKIYIEAEDPDSEMLRIAAVADQTGYGIYPTDWIYLKSPYRKHFKGYLQWNTFSSNASYLREWTQISLRVSVEDKAGHESNEVVFPFTFQLTPNQYAYKPPAPFDDGDLPRLGYVMVDLYSNDGYGNRGSGMMH